MDDYSPEAIEKSPDGIKAIGYKAQPILAIEEQRRPRIEKRPVEPKRNKSIADEETKTLAVRAPKPERNSSQMAVG